MTERKRVRQVRAVQGVLSALCAFGACSAHADNTFGVQLGAGVADHNVKKFDLGLVWDPGLQWWHVGGYHFTVVGEAHAAYWKLDAADAVYSHTWEFGVTPVFRFIKDSGWIRPFIEAGVGIRFLSHLRETPDRAMSTSFQFADMVGVGAQFGEHGNYQAGFRFQHLSNADIKRPNPGANFSQVYVQYNF
ncbi:acyloxyacyl hydrolase [Paraburkholderia lycopersici]|uniref:Lipid A deacylase n=1 Tax=Paraburkholderia lycopersici TaxID=416944 RepID=A0A1G6I8U9_9BURK|nr:acyloxyacyl hydrolase [Paraburkholderia lycopersici]SDC02793.1 Lipid A 3-O-deacylase (PagL) [Paraburkholderia lycopersici]